MILLLQDVVSIWTKIAEQGIAIAVMALILFFIVFLVIKILPTWERVKTAESEAVKAQAKSLGELALSQTQLATVVKEVAVVQRQSTEQVKIIQRVNAKSTEQLTNDVQELNVTLQDFNERLDRLEKRDVG